MRYRQTAEALELVGLSGIERRLVKKLTEHEKKLLGYAAALMGNPDLVLVDEPLARNATDEQKAEIFSLVGMLGRKKTLLVATDDLSLARALCDDAIILSDGRILAQGSFDALDARLDERGDGDTLDSLYASLVRASECGGEEESEK